MARLRAWNLRSLVPETSVSVLVSTLSGATVDPGVAISTERDQIFLYVVTQQASRAHVVDLKTIGTAAVLASPAVTFQHFGAEFAIRIGIESKSRSSGSETIHWTFPICCTNSIFCESGSNE
jgi:hypothetical protein